MPLSNIVHTLDRIPRAISSSSSPQLEFLEEFGHILFPVLGVLVVVIIVTSIVHAWRTPNIDGIERARLKGEIVRAMRNHIGWTTAQEVGDKLGVDTHTAAALMNEMKDDGLLISSLMEGHIHYRIKTG